MEEQLILIRTLDGLKDLSEYVQDKEFIAFDVETTGVEKGSEIIGFSICAELDKAYYVIISYWSPEEKKLIYLETKEGVPAFLEKLKSKKLITQNGGFDAWMTDTNFDVFLIDSIHTDTLLGGHLLNENRSNGLKERGVELFGEDARKEQEEMKASVHKNGGMLTKAQHELYKADPELIGRYGAKDGILTLKLFYNDVPQIFDEGLDRFFYEDETMPLYLGPTYDMNTTGLRVDPEKLDTLRKTLEAECLESKGFIQKEILPYVEEKYPATSSKNSFNINASKQLTWLLFFKLNQEFHSLTKSGKEVCQALGLKLPYSPSAKREFIRQVTESKGQIYSQGVYNYKTKKTGNPKKIADPWHYIQCGRETLIKYSNKYKWVDELLKYKKNEKLLNTYVLGIQSRMRYNVIHPNFLQHGTTSGRYSCKNPNFQNLPRKDKRIKACIVARPGKVFVGADYSQLEPRVFASHSGDTRLLECFKSGDDFYSVVGMEIFDKHDCSLKKEAPDSFAIKYPDLRDKAKVIALAAPYGQTAWKLAPSLGVSIEQAEELITQYFEKWPSVKQMQLNAHDKVRAQGFVTNLFGRPRRIPKATSIPKKAKHKDLPYESRTLLNLAVNHEIQSTGASIMNRAAIACWRKCRELRSENELWKEVKIVMQVHDELILEGPESLADQMVEVLKYAMEHTVELPGVDLIAEPKIAKVLSDLK